jgi:hypothetical protein
MHLMALLFAREADVEPDLRAWSHLARALLFGPLSAISFRVSGPDRLQDVGERIATEAKELGTVVSPRFSTEEAALLQALAVARKDPKFVAFVDRVTQP